MLLLLVVLFPFALARVPDRDEAAPDDLRHRHVDAGDQPAAAAARLHPRGDVLLASDPLRPVRHGRLRQRLLPVLAAAARSCASARPASSPSPTMLAISSGALFSLVLQTAMIVWDRGLAFLRSRWVIGIALGAATFVVLLVVGAGRAVHLRRREPDLRPGRRRAPARHLLLRHARRCCRHPWFGVGLGEWARPFWRPHPTIDSFWLMTAVRHGIPGILLLMVGLLVGMAADRHRAGPRRGRRPLPLGLPDRALRPAARPRAPCTSGGRSTSS